MTGRPLAGVVVGLGLLFVSIVPAQAAAAACEPAAYVCDADGDGYSDVVERAICGSVTCATGAEDVDANGVRDVVEFAEFWGAGGAKPPVQLTTSGAAEAAGTGEISPLSFVGIAVQFLGSVAVAAVLAGFRRVRHVDRMMNRKFRVPNVPVVEDLPTRGTRNERTAHTEPG